MITKFALLNKDGKLCYPFIHCRAYVGQKISIYFSRLDPKSIKIGAIVNSDGNYRENLQKIFNDFENELGIKKTVIELTVNKNNDADYNSNSFIITGSRWWAIANPVVSLYTLLLRMYSKILHYNPDGSTRKVFPEFKIGEDEELLKPYTLVFSCASQDVKDYLQIYPYILPFMKNLRGIFGDKREPNYELGSCPEYSLNYTGINSFIMNTLDPEDPNSEYKIYQYHFQQNSKYYNNYINWLKKKRELIGV